MTALLLESIHPDATAHLQGADIEVSTRAGALDEHALVFFDTAVRLPMANARSMTVRLRVLS